MKRAFIGGALFMVAAAVAQTALPPPEIKLSSRDFMGPRQAPPPTTADGFTVALTGPANKCASIGYKAHSEASLDYRSQGTENARAALETCIDNARHAGGDAYKAFASGPAPDALKASGKDLFAAWLAYLPGWALGERGTQTEANYKQAFSRFQVDAMSH